ncbi:MAG: lytic transglycosylase domain-containing protein [Acidimicrobiales bacterium]|nr:lytic transglycosylase domain-containing protein [Acidimicrobiales bacterium]
MFRGGRRHLFTVLAFLLAPLLLGLGIDAGAGAQTPPAETAAVAPVGSTELFARVDALRTELSALESEHHSKVDAVVAAGQRLAEAQVVHDAAATEAAASSQRLRSYAVSVYMTGDVVPDDVSVRLLTEPEGDLDAEAGRVLALSVHGTLVDDARRADEDLQVAQGALDDATLAERTAYTEAESLLQRRDALAAEIEVVRAEAEAALAREEAERRAEQERLAFEAFLRSVTAQPVSFASGVVPPMSVPGRVTVALGGAVSPIALNAYWRAAGLANGWMPGCNIDWALLAAIGKVETGHGTYGGAVVAADGSTAPTILGIPLDGSRGTARIPDTDGGALDGDPSVDRAVGPMQFIPGTWRGYATDGNGDGVADPHNLYDAAAAAGRYLCRNGGGTLNVLDNAVRAVYAYNRSTAYNVQVLTLADSYRRTVDPSLPPMIPVPPVTGEPDDEPGSPRPTLPPAPDPGPTTTTTGPTTTTSAPPTTTSTTAAPATPPVPAGT